MKKLHELTQEYFELLYNCFDNEVKQSMYGKSNEIYGELYYYSIVKLLRYLKITATDHFLDIGSGLGKLVFQIFLTTNAASVTGVEINSQRYNISCNIKDNMKQQLPDMFDGNRILDFFHDDFLMRTFDNISIIYVCSTVFSFDFLKAIGRKVNNMNSVRKIVSLRKLPNVDGFKLSNKMFLHGTWDNSACYIYTRET